MAVPREHVHRSFQGPDQLRPFVLSNVTATGKQLGCGSYGSVEELEMDGLVCAGKKMHDILIQYDSEHLVDRYYRQCVLLSELRHPNIVQFLGICFLPDSHLPMIVMELLHGNFHDVLLTRADIPHPTKLSILQDVARGLVFLHNLSPAVIHSNLTATNILLNAAMTAKIAGLGSSERADIRRGQLVQVKLPGSPVYMPPEAHSTKGYGLPLDIFSFGHLTLFAAIQVFPADLYSATFTDPQSHQVIDRTEIQRRETYITTLDRKLGKKHSLVVFIKECLANEPEKRPTSRQVLERLGVMMTAEQDPYHRMNRFDLEIALREKEAQVEHQASEKTASEGKMRHLVARLQQVEEEKNSLIESQSKHTYTTSRLLQTVPSELALASRTTETTHVHKYTGKNTILPMPESGIEMNIPAALRGTSIGVSVTIVPFDDEQFIFPENVSLVSAIYKVTTTETLPVPVTMRMQHCVPYEDHDEPYLTGLAFITASDNGPPYKFKPVSDGKFPRASSYGQIDVTSFSFWAMIWWWWGWPMSFFIGVFYRNLTARFVVTKNLESHISDIKKQYNVEGWKLEFEQSMMCDKYTNAIALQIPPNEECNGWRVLPTSRPTRIDMANIQQYGPGRVCPNIELQMEWIRTGPPKATNIDIGIEGGTLESFVLCCKQRESQDSIDSPHTPMLEYVVTPQDFAGFPKPELIDLMNIVGVDVQICWRDIGLGLGITESELSAIGVDFDSSKQCISRVFTDWENGATSEYSWKKLAEVLCTPLVKKQGLLADIHARLCSKFNIV